MKKCPKCGKKLNDDATLCVACGSDVPADVPAKSRKLAIGAFFGALFAALLKGFNKNKKKCLIIAGAVLAAIVLFLVLFFTVFSANAAAKRTVKAYFKAKNARDASKIVEIMNSDPVLEDHKAVNQNDVKLQENQFKTLDDLYGSDWKIKKLKVKNVRKITDKELQELQTIFQIRYKMEITEAKEMDVSYMIKGETKTDTFSGTATVIKYDGKWYLYSENTKMS